MPGTVSEVVVSGNYLTNRSDLTDPERSIVRYNHVSQKYKQLHDINCIIHMPLHGGHTSQDRLQEVRVLVAILSGYHNCSFHTLCSLTGSLPDSHSLLCRLRTAIVL
jgi:hypothetical protein